MFLCEGCGHTDFTHVHKPWFDFRPGIRIQVPDNILIKACTACWEWQIPTSQLVDIEIACVGLIRERVSVFRHAIIPRREP